MTILAQSIHSSVISHNVFSMAGETDHRTVTIPPLVRAWIKNMPSKLSAIPRLRRPERTSMSKSNLEDGVADAIAATALISVALVALMIWLSGLPS